MLNILFDCIIYYYINTYVFSDSKHDCFDVYFDCSFTVIEIKGSHTYPLPLTSKESQKKPTVFPLYSTYISSSTSRSLVLDELSSPISS